MLRLTHLRTLALLVAVLILAAACSTLPLPMATVTPAAATPAPGATPEPGAAPAGEPTLPAVPAGSGGVASAGEAAAVDAARDALAVELGLSLADLRVVYVEAVEWRDACLEVSRPDVMCAQVITPGYRIVLEAKGEKIEMRTDAEGRSVLRAGPRAVTTPIPAAVNAVAQLASQLGLELNDVRIVSTEAVDWPDACLGAGRPDEGCLLAVTPGYRIVLEANNRQYVFHADAAGREIRPAPGTAATEEPATAADWLVSWRHTDADGCVEAFLGRDEVRFGKCGVEPTIAEYAADTRRAEQLAEMQAVFAPFAADTAAGKVSFNGQGAMEPGPAEQRMLAEFAAAVYSELQAGEPVANWGMGWRRTGGIAGFCDDLLIDATGHAVLRSCKSQPAEDRGWRRLNEAELEQFYTWLDTLGAVQVEQKDPAVADAMTINVIFSGRAADDRGEVSAEEQATLIRFGSDLVARWSEPAPAVTATPAGA